MTAPPMTPSTLAEIEAEHRELDNRLLRRDMEQAPTVEQKLDMVRYEALDKRIAEHHAQEWESEYGADYWAWGIVGAGGYS